MIHKYVNFEALDNIMEAFGGEDYNMWKPFYVSYKKKGGSIDIKDLKTFVDIFVDIRDNSGNLISYNSKDFYNCELYDIQIHPEFSAALYLNQFL